MKNLHYELFHQVDYIGIDDKQKISFIMELVQHWGVSSIIAEIAEVLQMKKCITRRHAASEFKI